TERVEVVHRLRLSGRTTEVEPAVEVVADRLSVEAGAVVELHTLAELEGPLLAVRAVIPRLRQPWRQFSRAGLVRNQRLEHLAVDPEGFTIRGERRVEVRRRAGSPENELALSAATLAALTLGTPSHAGGERDGG